MSRADELYKATCRKILEEGFSDEGQPVRPHGPDGTPAHTIKTFGVVGGDSTCINHNVSVWRNSYAWKCVVTQVGNVFADGPSFKIYRLGGVIVDLNPVLIR